MAEQQQLSGHERRAMEQLVAFLSQCSTHGKALRERLSTVPGGWRDWRLMESLAAKLYCALGETLTDRQFIQFKKLEQFGTCQITLTSAARGNDYDFVSMSALKTIIRTCVESHCSMCVKNDADIRGCGLRKNLMDIVPAMDVPKYGCPYRELDDSELD